MLDLYKLEIFSLVAQTGSFTKTADMLLLSQSAISQHIKGLETGLGVTLFERSRSGTKLTATGEIFLSYVQQILDLTIQAENAVTDVSNLEKGQLSLGATIVAGSYLLPTWIREFRQQYPNLHISLQTATAAPILAALCTRRITLAIVEGVIPEKEILAHLVLQEVQQVLLIGRNHPWKGRSKVSIEELHGQSLIMRSAESQTRQWLDSLFVKYNVSPKVVLEFDKPETIKHSVIDGRCATFLPMCMVPRELKNGDLSTLVVPEIQHKRSLKLVWLKKRPFSAIDRAFIASLTKTYPHLQALLT